VIASGLEAEELAVAVSWALAPARATALSLVRQAARVDGAEADGLAGSIGRLVLASAPNGRTPGGLVAAETLLRRLLGPVAEPDRAARAA